MAFSHKSTGLEVTEIAVSGLPGNPTAVWTVKQSARAENDKFIVVSFTNSTLVLDVGESVIEVPDSGFLGTTSTLIAANIGEDGLIQVNLFCFNIYIYIFMLTFFFLK